MGESGRIGLDDWEMGGRGIWEMRAGFGGKRG